LFSSSREFGVDNARARILVCGLVQGVGFRWFVFHHAELLELLGFVSNLPNGDVLIEVEGEVAKLEELIRQIKVGPRSSRVTRVGVEWMTPSEPGEPFTRFEIR
jgi:acylphosphatase